MLDTQRTLISTRRTAGPLFALLFCTLIAGGCRSTKPGALQCTQLPLLPDTEGFAAMFAGVDRGVLLVAGGAKFPDKRPWEGGVKQWYDTVYALLSPQGQWQVVGQLPRPDAYGISATISAGVICAGGGNAAEHFADVFLLRRSETGITTTALPPLPRPCAFMSGAVVGSVLYIVGGIDSPGATACLNTFWSLDTTNLAAGWQQLDPCPGPPRMLAVAGSAGDSFYIFSGASLHEVNGKPVRTYLRDAWKYNPANGWTRLPDMPRAAVAAPSPAPYLQASNALLILSGDDGKNVGFQPPTQHPGFPTDTLVFDMQSESWRMQPIVSSNSTSAPFSRATTPTTYWNGRWIIPSGEVRPGYRTPAVWGVPE